MDFTKLCIYGHYQRHPFVQNTCAGSYFATATSQQRGWWCRNTHADMAQHCSIAHVTLTLCQANLRAHSSILWTYYRKLIEKLCGKSNASDVDIYVLMSTPVEKCFGKSRAAEHV